MAIDGLETYLTSCEISNQDLIPESFDAHHVALYENIIQIRTLYDVLDSLSRTAELNQTLREAVMSNITKLKTSDPSTNLQIVLLQSPTTNQSQGEFKRFSHPTTDYLVSQNVRNSLSENDFDDKHDFNGLHYKLFFSTLSNLHLIPQRLMLVDINDPDISEDVKQELLQQTCSFDQLEYVLTFELLCLAKQTKMLLSDSE